MDIVLYPRAAPGDRVRVWIGAFQATSAPNLVWSLDGHPAIPNVLRSISSVRPDNLLPNDTPPDQQPRVFAGVYEFTGLNPDTFHSVSVDADGVPAHLEVRTLPASVPTQIDRSFNVLLVSCFHQAEDRGGLAGIVVSQLKSSSSPDLTLLLGDQVYLDLPTLKNFPDDRVRLAEKFEGDYRTNWRGPTGYGQVLDAAPSLSLPDDHEFWNNYPHASPLIANSLSGEGRENWRTAAKAVYEGFQLPYPCQLGEPFVLDVPPLSFFFADTRSLRDYNLAFMLTDDAHTRLSEWVNDVIAHRKFGVFITGQSLFAEAVGSITGAVADYELPNYGDYGRVVGELQRIIDEAHRPVLCITGDVHFGRIAEARDITTGRSAITEVISSPASLVTTLGVDTVKRVGGFFRGLFGRSDPWTRHSEPAVPPAFLASDSLGGRFPCSTVFGQRGNHVTLLSFRQSGGGIECRVTYWPIHPDRNVGRPIDAGILEFTTA